MNLNEKIPFFDYLDSIKIISDSNFDKNVMTEQISSLQKKFSKELVPLSFHSQTKNDLMVFPNTNIELILLELLRSDEKELSVIYELTKNELFLLQSVLETDIDEVVSFICLNQKDQIYRISDLAKNEHRTYINIVLKVNYDNLIQFIKSINLLLIIGMPPQCGFYKKRNKIAMIDVNYNLIFNSKFYDTIRVKEIFNFVKRKTPDFPKSIFMEDE